MKGTLPSFESVVFSMFTHIKMDVIRKFNVHCYLANYILVTSEVANVHLGCDYKWAIMSDFMIKRSVSEKLTRYISSQMSQWGAGVVSEMFSLGEL